MPVSATAAVAPFSVAIASSPSHVLDIGLPVLGGLASEAPLAGARTAGRHGCLSLARTHGWLAGGAVVPVRGDLGLATARVYREIFAAVGAGHLARVWNYVPEINRDGQDGLENYRTFCRSRSLAFEERFGPGFDALLPAASAVGGPAGSLAVVFVAGDTEPLYVENPLQMPAYRYPREHGPRPPSFSRATVVAHAGSRRVFISGTAAIRGHETVAPDCTADQVGCTLGNLAVISEACGLGPNLAAERAAHRHFKVYVRHPHELGDIARVLDRELFRPDDSVSYLQAAICRRALKVEIEATISVA